MTDTMREAHAAGVAVTHPERPPLRRPRGSRRQAGRSVSSADPRTGAIPLAEPPAGPVPAALPAVTPPNGTGPIRQLLGPVTGSLRLGRGRPDASVDQRLQVDWPQCRAHGLCAEIAPEVIHLDEWGYPLFDPGTLLPEDSATARKAVQVCPTLALRLVEVPPGQ